MSDRVLTTEELDALMNGMPTGVEAHDLSIVEDYIAGNDFFAIDAVFGRFSRFFTRSLFAFSRLSVEVTPGGVASMKCSDLLETKDRPAIFSIFEAPPLPGSGLLVLETELIFKLLNSSFGGAPGSQGKSVDLEGREFTLFENRFIDKIAQMVLTEIENALKPYLELEFNLKRSQTSPDFVEGALLSETVMVYTFQIEMEGFSSLLSISIPCSYLDSSTMNPGTKPVDIISPVEGIKEPSK